MQYLSKNKNEIARNRDLFSRFDDMFTTMTNRMFSQDFMKEYGIQTQNVGFPKFNIVKTDKEIEITAAVPGYSKNEVSIEFDNGLLVITGEKDHKENHKEEEIVLREIKQSKFTRAIDVSMYTIEPKHIDAEYKDGLLSIKLPYKQEEERVTTQQIAIRG